jgi:ferredoxin
MIVLMIVLSLFLLCVILFFLPIGRAAFGEDTPKTRVDERDIMFARARLRPDSPEFESYYAMHPENREKDDAFRALPGLLSPDSRFADPYLFAAPKASFFLTEALRSAVDGPAAGSKSELPADRMTAYVKNLARYFGALDVGVAEIQPYHIYSHVGRGAGRWGDPIEEEYRSAIALTVAMDAEMIAAAPAAPTLMESARQYVEAARAAVQLAAALRDLGYPARAHIDGNYRVIAPLVARDAGLGELGRMGLLMTPRLGPRVRIAVVTTEAPLVPDARHPASSVLDFCNICHKCADACPAQAIPTGLRAEIDGALRWRIDSDRCFHYWNKAGTDCARCIAVCPFAHRAGGFHDLVRAGIVRSGFFRRLAKPLDDLFYGKKPAPHPGPSWIKYSG